MKVLVVDLKGKLEVKKSYIEGKVNSAHQMLATLSQLEIYKEGI